MAHRSIFVGAGLLSILLLASIPSIRAEENVDLSPDLLARRMQALLVEVRQPHGTPQPHAFDPGIRFENNVPPDVRELITGDLEQLAAVRGTDATPMHRRIFGDVVDGRVYLQWLKERIWNVRLGQCPAPSFGCYSDRDHTFTIMEIGAFRSTGVGLSAWERIRNYIHEARHHERLHETCERTEIPEPKPDWDRLAALERFKVGAQFGCDRTADGAHGTAAIFTANLRQYCGNCGFDASKREDLQDQTDFSTRWVLGENARRELNADIGSIARSPASK